MREILFRAWSKERKCYEIVNINNGKPVRKGYQWFLKENDLHDSELEQFTGLTDKNGVKIFEGDVVNSEYYGIGVVKYGKYYDWSKDDDEDSNSFGWFVKYEDYEFALHNGNPVIGNIHDNKEKSCQN